MAKSRLAIGAIIGAAAGVIAGVLTAPKSGKEIRTDLKDKAGGLKTKAESRRDEIVDKTKNAVDDLMKNQK